MYVLLIVAGDPMRPSSVRKFFFSSADESHGRAKQCTVIVWNSYSKNTVYPYMAIDGSVHYNGGLLPDIIMLTLCDNTGGRVST